MTKEELKAHEQHAWTLAFLVFAGVAVAVYLLDEWLSSPRRGYWAELADMALYVFAFFAVFGLSHVQHWFLSRLTKGR
ncbi:hypothetical protein [Pseudomonas petrae]|uniref:Uncharacterized protein n=1 Tax=Pseudomonas petrae TaxID=2912190 RepID=A0ABS9ICQ0_9PSED|nr:hypothetical protein [Pseudomonas petrae]MCF7532052.1 hypothetical protein [Pseudomonas petrae]MCF7537608.1 hypothetical protein [Pseudomonas petrae]MCF7545502.1 hypothetical protein [Pseudomonas petrae]